MRQCALLVFFSKQKTAYDLHSSLEFRRVLFRSGSAATTIAIGERRSRSRRASRASLTTMTSQPCSAAVRRRRSEERRVGKEWRGRGSRERRENKGSCSGHS